MQSVREYLLESRPDFDAQLEKMVRRRRRGVSIGSAQSFMSRGCRALSAVVQSTPRALRVATWSSSLRWSGAPAGSRGNTRPTDSPRAREMRSSGPKASRAVHFPIKGPDRCRRGSCPAGPSGRDVADSRSAVAKLERGDRTHRSETKIRKML